MAILTLSNSASIRGNAIKKIATSLGTTLAIALSSTWVLAADVDVLAGLADADRPSVVTSAMTAVELGLKCMPIDESVGTTWNGGKFCLADNLSKLKTGLLNSDVKSPPITAGVSRPLGGSGDFTGEDMPGAECASAGGSTAAPATAGGFCVAADARGPTGTFTNFALDNGIPFAGAQFLQVVFRDGSTVVGTSSLGASCRAAGGGSASIGTPGGFCIGSDLDTLTTGFARFGAANELPVAALQFLQITFAGDSPGAGAPMGTTCVSSGGSTASSGTAGGFCLASDLATTRTNSVANFSVANELPVSGVQFLQITFSNDNPGGGGQGVECVSNAGSTASIGNSGGACQASDHASINGFAHFTLANELPAAGIQFLQATFGEGIPLGDPIAECISVNGSTASTGNSEGFCLVSDRGVQRRGLANLSVANDLPVSEFRYIQVPMGDGNPKGVFRPKPRRRAPIGISLSDCATSGRDPTNLPALALSAGTAPSYRNVFDQEIGLRSYRPKKRRNYGRPAFLPGTRSDLTPRQQRRCVRRTSQWGQLRF